LFDFLIAPFLSRTKPFRPAIFRSFRRSLSIQAAFTRSFPSSHRETLPNTGLSAPLHPQKVTERRLPSPGNVLVVPFSPFCSLCRLPEIVVMFSPFNLRLITFALGEDLCCFSFSHSVPRRGFSPAHVSILPPCPSVISLKRKNAVLPVVPVLVVPRDRPPDPVTLSLFLHPFLYQLRCSCSSLLGFSLSLTLSNSHLSRNSLTLASDPTLGYLVSFFSCEGGGVNILQSRFFPSWPTAASSIFRHKFCSHPRLLVPRFSSPMPVPASDPEKLLFVS